MDPLSADLAAELDAVFAELDAEIATHSPRCDVSGRCCRFDEYGHTLFLCELEARRLMADGLPPGAVVAEGLCPFQIAGRCTARERRPTGCRSYFCDPAFAEVMPEIAERSIRRLKALHERFGLPWNYAPLHRFLHAHFSANNLSQPTHNPLSILDSRSCRQ